MEEKCPYYRLVHKYSDRYHYTLNKTVTTGVIITDIIEKAS